LIIRVFGPGFTQEAQARAALFAESFLTTIGRIAPANPNTVATHAAKQHHIGDRNGHFLGQPASLSIAATGLHVPVNFVDAFHQNLVCFGQNFEDSACGAGFRRTRIIAGNDLDNVVFFYVHDSNLTVIWIVSYKPAYWRLAKVDYRKT
jgi:hypothetical protein